MKNITSNKELHLMMKKMILEDKEFYNLTMNIVLKNKVCIIIVNNITAVVTVNTVDSVINTIV